MLTYKSRMTAIPASRETRAPQLNVVVAAAAVLSLALRPVEIHRAFGLPAHPLLIHVPVVFIILTALLIGALFTRARRIVLAVAAITAAAAVFWVIRTGHLGAKLAWANRDRAGRRPACSSRALDESLTISTIWPVPSASMPFAPSTASTPAASGSCAAGW